MPTVLVRPDTLYAWRGPSLLIVNTNGECAGDKLCGFYHHEARFLETLRLEINGKRPWRCEAAALAPDTLTFHYVHPEITQPGGGGTGQSGDEEQADDRGIPERALTIDVTYRTRLNRLDVTLVVGNHARQALAVDLAWIAGADFADIQETQGRREQQAPVVVTTRDGVLEFAYGHGQLPYRTELRCGGDWRTSDGRLDTTVTLAPQQRASLMFQVVPVGAPMTMTEAEADERERAWERWRDGFTAVEVPGNRALEAAVGANVRDFASFALFTGRKDEWLATQAGMPLYPAFFGRDAVTAGWQAALVDGGQSLDAALTASAASRARAWTTGATSSRAASPIKCAPARSRNSTSTRTPPTTPTSRAP